MQIRITAAVLILAALATLIMVPSASAASPAEAAAGVYHVVQRGETMYRISRMYGVTVNAIAQANGISNPSYIRAGQRLLIPSGSIAGCGYQIHIVKPGETLYRLAVRYGVTVWQIVQANRLANPNLIYAGQRLIISQSSITISTPTAGAVLEGSVRVSGTGRAFENTLMVEVQTAAGTVLARNPALINAEVGQYGPYAVELTFTAPATTQAGRVVVWRESPADGSVAERSCVEVVLKGTSS